MMNTPSTINRKKILVTGGLGFIGSNLVRALVDGGNQVYVVDNLLRGQGGNMFNLSGYENRFEYLPYSLYSAQTLKMIPQMDVIYHLAAQTRHFVSMQRPITDIHINVQNTIKLLETCRRVNPHAQIVFTSTRQVYGIPKYLPVDEAHPVSPVDVNGINKYSAEQFCQLYARVYGVGTTILRLSNTYGPRMGLKGASLPLIAHWIKNLFSDSPLDIWNGDLIRDFSYVDDVVQALLIAQTLEEKKAGIYNIGGIRSSLFDLANNMIAISGRGSYRFRKYPDKRKRIEIGTIYVDDSRFRNETGWKPLTDLPEGLRNTLDYFAQYIDRYL